MKNRFELAQTDKYVSPLTLTKRLMVRSSLNFVTSPNQARIQKAFSRLDWLTVIRTARNAGLNA